MVHLLVDSVVVLLSQLYQVLSAERTGPSEFSPSFHALFVEDVVLVTFQFDDFLVFYELSKTNCTLWGKLIVLFRLDLRRLVFLDPMVFDVTHCSYRRESVE